MQSKVNITIAIVDDDRFLLDALHDFFESIGINSATYDTAQMLLDSGDLDDVACVLTDFKMPGMSGLELLRILSERGSPPVCVMTAFPDERTRMLAFNAGARAFLEKPVQAHELIQFIASVGAK